MDKRSFIFFLIVTLVAFGARQALVHYRPASAGSVNFDSFPMQLGDWQGTRRDVPDYVIALLNPEDILSVDYINRDGVRVGFLLDFFSSDATTGGPHSPRNCLPGSGWTISDITVHSIIADSRIIRAGRFDLRFRDDRQVMDFWYITHFGITANDYKFKLYQLLGAFTFKPRDVAFVRFTAANDEKSLTALNDFEHLVIGEIYRQLPFD